VWYHSSFVCATRRAHTHAKDKADVYPLVLCICAYDVCVKSRNELFKWHDWLIFQSNVSDRYLNMTHMSNTTHINLVRMCDITHSCVLHMNENVCYHAFKCVAHEWKRVLSRIHVCGTWMKTCVITHSSVWHMNENVCYTHSYVWHMNENVCYHAFMCVAHEWKRVLSRIHVCGTWMKTCVITYSCVWHMNDITHVSNITHMSHVRMCDVTHSCLWQMSKNVWHRSFMCVAQERYSSHVSNITQVSHLTMRNVTHSHLGQMHENMWNYSIMCVRHRWLLSYR